MRNSAISLDSIRYAFAAKPCHGFLNREEGLFSIPTGAGRGWNRTALRFAAVANVAYLRHKCVDMVWVVSQHSTQAVHQFDGISIVQHVCGRPAERAPKWPELRRVRLELRVNVEHDEGKAGCDHLNEKPSDSERNRLGVHCRTTTLIDCANAISENFKGG